MKTKTTKMSAQAKRAVERAAEIMAQLEANKPLYAELDKITEALAGAGFREGGGLRLVDNFAEKNVCFRPAAVRRFELKKEAA